MRESYVKVYSFQLRVKSIWEIRASLTPEGKRWRHFRGHLGYHLGYHLEYHLEYHFGYHPLSNILFR